MKWCLYIKWSVALKDVSVKVSVKDVTVSVKVAVKDVSVKVAVKDVSMLWVAVKDVSGEGSRKGRFPKRTFPCLRSLHS